MSGQERGRDEPRGHRPRATGAEPAHCVFVWCLFDKWIWTAIRTSQVQGLPQVMSLNARAVPGERSIQNSQKLRFRIEGKAREAGGIGEGADLEGLGLRFHPSEGL